MTLGSPLVLLSSQKSFVRYTCAFDCHSMVGCRGGCAYLGGRPPIEALITQAFFRALCRGFDLSQHPFSHLPMSFLKARVDLEVGLWWQ